MVEGVVLVESSYGVKIRVQSGRHMSVSQQNQRKIVNQHLCRHSNYVHIIYVVFGIAKSSHILTLRGQITGDKWRVLTLRGRITGDY